MDVMLGEIILRCNLPSTELFTTRQFVYGLLNRIQREQTTSTEDYTERSISFFFLLHLNRLKSIWTQVPFNEALPGERFGTLRDEHITLAVRGENMYKGQVDAVQQKRGCVRNKSMIPHILFHQLE